MKSLVPSKNNEKRNVHKNMPPCAHGMAPFLSPEHPPWAYKRRTESTWKMLGNALQ